MRQRITYLLRDADSFSPDQLQLRGRALAVDGLDAAKEVRLKRALDGRDGRDGAAVLSRLSRACSELYIRWTAATGEPPPPSPLDYPAPAGLLVVCLPSGSFQPQELCALLSRIAPADVRCDDLQHPFTTAAAVSGPAAVQYYGLSESARPLTSFVADELCGAADAACAALLASFADSASAVSVELDGPDGGSASVTAVFDRPADGAPTWTETIHGPADEAVRLEVGLLHTQPAQKRDEISLGGFLTVLAEDDHPKPALFSLTHRNFRLDQAYSVSWTGPTGLHPSLTLQQRSADLDPPELDCTLNAYLALPSHFFVDRYQLADASVLAHHGLDSLVALTGAADLEAPHWAVAEWGSAAVVQLRTAAGPAPASWTVPLHLRYLRPSKGTNGVRTAQLAWPALFWACPPAPSHETDDDDDEPSLRRKTPFERTWLGFDQHFEARTRFYHLRPHLDAQGMDTTNSGLILTLDVPVIDLDKAAWVEWGTILAVVLATAWILQKLAYIAWSDYNPSAKRKARAESQKKVHIS